MNTLRKPKHPAQRAVGHSSAVVIGFSVVMVLATGILVLALAVLTTNLQYDSLEPVISMLADVAGALCVPAVLYATDKTCHKKPGYFCGIRVRSRNHMTVGRFLFCLTLTAGIATLGDLVSGAVQWLCTTAGLSGASLNDSATSMATTSAIGFIAAGIVGPICEETIFRGTALPGLERYGKPFAIITTSVLFGCTHMDLYQGIGVSIISMAFTWVASEYSVAWSIVMHVFNNAILVGIPDLLMAHMSAATQNTINIAFLVAQLIIFAIVLVVERTNVRRYFTENRNSPHVWRAWRSPLFLCFVAVTVTIAIVRIIQ